MTIRTTDYIDVKQRALDLDCNEPTGMCILPRNFETAKSKKELVNESSAATLRILLRQSNITVTRIEKEGDKLPEASEKEFVGWVGPIVFISSALLSENPKIVSLALGVLSAYLHDWFKGIVGEKKVKLEIVTETKSGTYRRLHYEGDTDGLGELPKIVREMTKDK